MVVEFDLTECWDTSKDPRLFIGTLERLNTKLRKQVEDLRKELQEKKREKSTKQRLNARTPHLETIRDQAKCFQNQVEDEKNQCAIKAKELQTLENKDKTTVQALDRELA